MRKQFSDKKNQTQKELQFQKKKKTDKKKSCPPLSQLIMYKDTQIFSPKTTFLFLESEKNKIWFS